MFRNPFGGNPKRARREQRPEVCTLEGRALLSAFHPHAHAAAARAMHSRHAAMNTMHVTHATTTQTGNPTLTSPAPGQFGPNTSMPFAGYRPGGYFLHSASTPSRSAASTAAADPAATTTQTGNPTLTSPASGEFGPNTSTPFPGYRPGGYFLH